MSNFFKTPVVKTYNSSAHFMIQIPEEGNEEGTTQYIILFRPDELYEIFLYNHETTPSTDYSIIWKNNDLSQLSEYIYKLIIYNKMYVKEIPKKPIYFTTNFGIKNAKVFTQELKSFLLEMLFYLQNITVEK
jgi:hypothetical protein